MANKRLEIHPAALAEFKSAVVWYMERNQIAATRFVAEVDRAIDLIVESPARWPAAERGTRRMIQGVSHTRLCTGTGRMRSKYWLSHTVTGSPNTGRTDSSGDWVPLTKAVPRLSGKGLLHKRPARRHGRRLARQVRHLFRHHRRPGVRLRRCRRQLGSHRPGSSGRAFGGGADAGVSH